ncbi:tail fiber protein [uncultured Aquimarina sp.]|uniref:tail fiber protein n=1 Tax=uncultured Aquimarina sp. TaxID=575652 RepID=UPI00262BFBCD|nr:tail fiber protein [uncultured Aquimarina sp.]
MRKNVILLIGFVMISFCGMAQIPTNQGHYLEHTNSAGELYRGHLIQWNRLSLGLWNDGNAFSIEDFSEFNATNTYKNLFRVNLNGNVGIGTTNPDAKLSIYLPNGTASYPTASSSGNLFFKSRSSNSGMEFGNSIGFNDRKAWIIARHSDVASYGKYYSTLHLQPDVGDKSQYRGVSIGYEASTQLPVNTHLAVSGNVGIGTTEPNERLQVNGNISAFDGNIILHNSSINQEESGTIRWNEYPGGTNLNQSGAFITYNGDNNYLKVATNDENNSYEHIRIYRGSRTILQPNSGNVGIGTTNPQEKLKIVNGSVSVDSSSDGSNAFEFGNNYGQMYYDAQSSGEQNRGMYFQEQLSTNRGFHFLNSNGDRLLKINGNGNVGIGTNTPDAKLAVNGNIHTQEVKVDLVGWPDYVFEEDYNLPTLQEVEQHISENGHLENIPSAAEVAQNGIQLGEMNKKLLEKIEQLTLYMIEQNKKTDFLLKEVETLKKKNAALEARLK